MENYAKGKNVEEPLNRDSVPFKNLPSNFLWMQVHGGSKMRNLLDHALSCLETGDEVVWSGSGPALQKLITCVEITKRKYQMHQLNSLIYTKVEEHWDPLIEGLEPLVVTRKIPLLHVLLSKAPLDSTLHGYQAPTSKDKLSHRHMFANPARGKPRRKKNPQRTEMLQQFTKKEAE